MDDQLRWMSLLAEHFGPGSARGSLARVQSAAADWPAVLEQPDLLLSEANGAPHVGTLLLAVQLAAEQQLELTIDAELEERPEGFALAVHGVGVPSAMTELQWTRLSLLLTTCTTHLRDPHRARRLPVRIVTRPRAWFRRSSGEILWWEYRGSPSSHCRCPAHPGFIGL
ncbi:hypothetical protein D5S17_35890 [Pseudonocardiaceae bacterium YIM PH 21723]|nr:hypothetical protein D5S17_35890 [Pseudonocardiaceae bacterium YIM PH 21723]